MPIISKSRQPLSRCSKIICNFGIYDTFKYNGVTDDAIRLRLFHFSLCDNAYEWLDSQEPGSIMMWDKLVGKFLHKFSPLTEPFN
ncbi:Retrotransposon gag protein [Gossypium australe]|uniref:Retrotransposon gag protein n=1 Tax=Gossypium australe TaxID=47621 RepID=A0A5B6VX77_9ROSI|nr:Retrotransposon gag protein [Gossypium australe]